MEDHSHEIKMGIDPNTWWTRGRYNAVMNSIFQHRLQFLTTNTGLYCLTEGKERWRAEEKKMKRLRNCLSWAKMGSEFLCHCSPSCSVFDMRAQPQILLTDNREERLSGSNGGCEHIRLLDTEKVFNQTWRMLWSLSWQRREPGTCKMCWNTALKLYTESNVQCIKQPCESWTWLTLTWISLSTITGCNSLHKSNDPIFFYNLGQHVRMYKYIKCLYIYTLRMFLIQSQGFDWSQSLHFKPIRSTGHKIEF